MDKVEVEVQELEAMYQVLDTLYSFCLAQDLSNQYKNLSGSLKRSPLTAQTRRVADRVAVLLAQARPEDDEDDVPEEQ